jgi:hypothetical protein
LDQLQRWCVITHTDEPPSTDLAKATAYLLNHWQLRVEVRNCHNAGRIVMRGPLFGDPAIRST